MVPLSELEDGPRTSGVRRRIVVGAVVVAAAAGIIFAVTRPANESPAEAPVFSLRRLDGDGTITSAQLRGRPVVVNFWASWCEPCKEETPLLARTYEEYMDRGVEFVGIVYNDDPGAARGFARSIGVTYPLARDQDNEASSAFRIYGVPQTFFITCDWKLLDSGGDPDERPTLLGGESGPGGGAVLGGISREDLVAGIERLLDSESCA